jgi:hypothetical protein
VPGIGAPNVVIPFRDSRFCDVRSAANVRLENPGRLAELISTVTNGVSEEPNAARRWTFVASQSSHVFWSGSKR